MPLTLITPLATEPISLDDAKEQCRVDHTDQDGLLSRLITAARQYLEEITGRSFGEQTFELVLDRFPGGGSIDQFDRSIGVAAGAAARFHESGRLVGAHIILPRAPLLDVDSITYIDDAGDTQTLAAADYIVDRNSEPARVTPAYNTVWPVTQFRVNSVRVRFRAGYTSDSPGVDSPDTEILPDPLVHALLLKVQQLYDGTDVDQTIDALIAPYRLYQF